MPDKFLVQQITTTVPSLAVYAVGVILSIVYLSRYGIPAGLCLAGCLVLTLVTLTLVGLQMAMSQAGGADNRATYSSIMGAVSMIGRPLGIGLIVAAVFAGRTSPNQNYIDAEMLPDRRF